MITDQQVENVFQFRHKNKMTVKAAAAKAAMSGSTARKYLRSGKFPSELKKPPVPSRRVDVFAGVWKECVGFLEVDPTLEAKALFEYLMDTYPNQFSPKQLRTFQRRVQGWKAHRPKEVFFAQEYSPGECAQSDFTYMNSLEITIGGVRFRHLLYHFVLTYSNWESVMVCESESFVALAAGFEKAVTELGGVPQTHQTDSMSCAVKNGGGGDSEEFTGSYTALMVHYGVEPRRTHPRCPHENGKVEQSHHRLKNAVQSALTLRGDRDFERLDAYERFLGKLTSRLNAHRQSKLNEERAFFKALPLRPLDSCERRRVRVSKGSTILVKKNHYSVPSTLIGQWVEVRLYAQRIEVWSRHRLQEQMPRLCGEGAHSIHYRHVIRSLIRKPGAFAGYRYRADLFPTQTFRRAYDCLQASNLGSPQSDKAYLKFLFLAATESESGVEAALAHLLADQHPITVVAVEAYLQAPDAEATVDLGCYDGLLTEGLR